MVTLAVAGDGELRLRRPRDEGKHADIVEHSWGNHVDKKTPIIVKNGTLVIPFRERSGGGLPVEWIEVNL